jgi:hypothetical protein
MTHRTSSSLGFSLVECCVSLGIAGLLGLGGASALRPGSADLTAAQFELKAALEQARHLAHWRGTPVKVGVRVPASPDIIPVQVSRRLKWGKPGHIPLPPGMAKPAVATLTGEAHGTITVSPRHTATASAWFIHDGREAVCMRLSGLGHLQVLRWRSERRVWERV